MELQPPPNPIPIPIPIPGPQEQAMQVEASGLDEQTMQLFPGLDEEQTMQVEGSGPSDQIMQYSGLEEQTMQVSGQEEPGPKPYSIEFYQQRLMEMEMNQFIEHELNNNNAGRRAAEPEIDSLIEMSFDEEEGVEVDQYLNLDDDPDHAR